MRTTIDIPDELLKEAKRVALAQDSTLRELVARGLEKVIGEASRMKSRSRVEFPLLDLAPDCPLLKMTQEDLAAVLDEDEARNLDALYRRR